MKRNLMMLKPRSCSFICSPRNITIITYIVVIVTLIPRPWKTTRIISKATTMPIDHRNNQGQASHCNCASYAPHDSSADIALITKPPLRHFNDCPCNCNPFDLPCDATPPHISNQCSFCKDTHFMNGLSAKCTTPPLVSKLPKIAKHCIKPLTLQSLVRLLPSQAAN